MAQKYVAFRHDLDEPLEWMYRTGQLTVFHCIKVIGSVLTPDGGMIAVEIRQKADFENPDSDIVALVAKAKKVRKSGVIDPQSPELWYWNDRFWLKAMDSDGNDYYNKKRYLIYEVEIKNTDALLGGLKHAWQAEAENQPAS